MFTSRTNVVLGSFNVINRTSSYFCGWTLITVAKIKNDLGMLLSYSKTMSLTLAFCCTVFHFFLKLSDGIYSLINRLKYILSRLSTTLYLGRLSSSFLFLSIARYAFKDRPNIKWSGVTTIKLSVPSLTDVKGRLLIVPSIWTRVVINLCSRIGQLFVINFNAFFIYLFIDWLIDWLIHLFICLFTYLFIYSLFIVDKQT